VQCCAVRKAAPGCFCKNQKARREEHRVLGWEQTEKEESGQCRKVCQLGMPAAYRAQGVAEARSCLQPGGLMKEEGQTGGMPALKPLPGISLTSQLPAPAVLPRYARPRYLQHNTLVSFAAKWRSPPVRMSDVSWCSRRQRVIVRYAQRGRS